MMLRLSSLCATISLVCSVMASTDRTICAWFQSRSGTVRDALFIDGGTLINNTWDGTAWANSNPDQWNPKGIMYELNYSASFEYSDSPPDLNTLLQLRPLAIDASRYDAPLYRSGAMFTDDFELYTYGGLPLSSAESAPNIVNYRLFPVEWQTDNFQGPDLDYQLEGVDNYITAGASVSIPSEKLAFYFSGARNSNGGALEQYGVVFENVNSMLKVDLSSPGNATWTELPLDTTVPGRTYAQLVWVPVSHQGILLVIAGVPFQKSLYGNTLTADQESENQQSSHGFMKTISVYDIATDQWYNQDAAGEFPGPLSSSCSVVARQPDSASFEIYMYGGDDGWTYDKAATAQDDVWALSVPSFTWTKASSGNAKHGRSAHACSMPYPNQMLVFGGWNLNFDGTCIQDGSVVDVFDLNDLAWTRKYSPGSGSEYKTPSSIVKPVRAINSDIQRLFDTKYDDSKITVWLPQKGGGKSAPIAAIAGGAAGGGAALIVVLFLIWYFWPSRVRARRERRQSDAHTSSTFVSRWRAGIHRWSTDLPAGPKDFVSETTTEVDGQMSPPPTAAAEAYGDYYFPRTSHVSPLQHSPPAEISPSHSPRQISYTSAQSFRSPGPPGSPNNTSFEVDGEEVHEKDGIIPKSQLSGLGHGSLDFRRHPEYPYSIDRVASSDTNSKDGFSQARHGALGSNISRVSGYSRQSSKTTHSPVAAPANAYEVGGGVDANEKRTEPDTGVFPHRPTHHRNASSNSDSLPITPPANEYGTTDRPPLEMRMSATSGPISPLLQQEHPERPTHHRHDSSMSSGLSGNFQNIALPPPLNPTSPSSVYSPTSAGAYTNATVQTGTGAGTATSKAQQEESATLEAGSAEATLVGGGQSPMTEKMYPMAAIAAGLGDFGTQSSRSATRRKPVGGAGGGAGDGAGGRSAYEENGGSDRRALRR